MSKDVFERTIKPGGPGDQTKGMRRNTIAPCSKCGHPAVYHGRALPKCDVCDCTGYEGRGGPKT